MSQNNAYPTQIVDRQYIVSEKRASFEQDSNPHGLGDVLVELGSQDSVTNDQFVTKRIKMDSSLGLEDTYSPRSSLQSPGRSVEQGKEAGKEGKERDEAAKEGEEREEAGIPSEDQQNKNVSRTSPMKVSLLS